MIIIENLLIIFISVLYGFSLFYITELEFKFSKMLQESANLILAMACLTSIDFMSSCLGILSLVKCSCYIIILLIFIVLSKIIKRKNKNKLIKESSNVSNNNEDIKD